MMHSGLSQNQIAKHLVCPRTNGASTFQEVRFGVTTPMMTKKMPYIIGIHCMAHKNGPCNVKFVFHANGFQIGRSSSITHGYCFSSPKHYFQF